MKNHKGIKELKIRDYKGGAGPSKKQAEHNTRVLAQELKKLNIPFKENREWAKFYWDGDDLILEIFHPKKVGEIMMVGYDRWGFVIENVDSPVDQGTLKDTVAAIKKWYDV